METIKNVLGLGGSASKPNEETVPGQHPLSGEEPVSGQLGAGTATDPYDAGNAEGQSGSAPGQSSGSNLKASSSSESFKDNNVSSLKPTEAVPYSANLESSPSAQEGFSGAPGLQGHPLPITDFSAASLAEDSAPSHPDKQIGDVSPGRIDQEIQTEDTQAQGHVPERPSDTVTHSYARRDDYPRDDYTPGASESPTFVEREAARIAKETAPRDTTEDTGPSTSATVPDTDQDLAESTKKLHLKDKIKEKLHLRKKSEAS